MVLETAKLANEYDNFELPKFKLKNIDDSIIETDQLIGNKGLLVMFICNHCPYVKAIIHNVIEDALELEKLGIKSVAINSNNPYYYPANNKYYLEDSFDNMKKFAEENKFPFPYLIDENQEVAHKFKAVCTPDFFLFIKNNENGFILKYKGRLNDFVYRKDGPPDSRGHVNKRELLENAKNILENKEIETIKTSIGCAIKWLGENYQ